MKRLIGPAMGLLFVTMALPPAAAGGERPPGHTGGSPPHPGNTGGASGHHGTPGGSPIHVIPEFDPAALGAIGALVAGGVVLVARRRRR